MRKSVLTHSLCFSLLAGGLWPMAAGAQDLPPDDGGFEIETVEVPEETGFFRGLSRNIGRYVGATIGATYGGSEAVDKNLQAVNLQFNIPAFKSVKTVLNGDIGTYTNTYTLELSDQDKATLDECRRQDFNPAWADDPPDGDSGQQALQQFQQFVNLGCYRVIVDGSYLVPKLERIVQEDFAELNEAYVQWEPFSFATLKAGRMPVVLGQFELFSPLGFLMPLKATGTKTRSSRADMTLAQDGVQLSLFPLQQLEVQLTTIPKTRIDRATEKRNRQFVDLESEGLNFAPGQSVSEAFEDIGDHDTMVARVLYVGNLFTLGVTAIEGAETGEDMVRDARLSKRPCDYDVNFNPNDFNFGFYNNDCTESFFRDGSRFDIYELTGDEGLRYSDMSAQAVELNVPFFNKWNFTFEYSVFEHERQIDVMPRWDDSSRPRDYFPGFNDKLQPGNPNVHCAQDNPNDCQYDFSATYERILNENNGSIIFDMQTQRVSAGISYKGDKWLMNFQIAHQMQEGVEALDEYLREYASYDLFFDDDMIDAIPIINVARQLGAENQGYLGGGFGAFTQSYGMGVFGGWRFFERLEIGGFAGMALDITGADEIEARGYETPEDSVFVSVGVNYLF